MALYNNRRRCLEIDSVFVYLKAYKQWFQNRLWSYIMYVLHSSTWWLLVKHTVRKSIFSPRCTYVRGCRRSSYCKHRWISLAPRIRWQQKKHICFFATVSKLDGAVNYRVTHWKRYTFLLKTKLAVTFLIIKEFFWNFNTI